MATENNATLTPEQIKANELAAAAAKEAADKARKEKAEKLTTFRNKTVEFLKAIQPEVGKLKQAGQTLFGELFALIDIVPTQGPRIDSAARVIEINNELTALLEAGINAENMDTVVKLGAERTMLEAKIKRAADEAAKKVADDKKAADAAGTGK